jgi:hypothetical protein
VDSEDFYSVDEAARILKLTPGRIRQMLRGGELEGIPPGEAESGNRGWKIPMHVIHDRDRPDRVPRVARQGTPEAPGAPERLSDLEAEVRGLQYQLGLSRGRIELTEKAESTLRDALERERERADAERERAEKLQAEVDELRQPRPERRHSWWRRLFGS